MSRKHRVRSPRPVLTFYFDTVRDKREPVAISHSTTADRATVAAFRRILAGDFTSAKIYDESNRMMHLYQAQSGTILYSNRPR